MGSRKERILNYGRIFSDYKEELELALIQNCAVECELYSIVASVLRESESGRKVSIRDVSARRTTTESSYLKGESGFPGTAAYLATSCRFS